MTTKTWADFYDDVLPHVPGCSVEMARSAIIEAAVEFCDTSQCWLADLDPISTQADESTYDLDAPSKTNVTRVRFAWYDGKKLGDKTTDDLDALYQSWPDVTGTPLYFTQENPDQIILVPKPSAGVSEGLKCKVALVPTWEASGVDEAVWTHYRKAIAKGALAKLMLSPKKPYSNAELGAFNQDGFTAAIDSARFNVLRGFNRARRRARPQFC